MEFKKVTSKREGLNEGNKASLVLLSDNNKLLAIVTRIVRRSYFIKRTGLVNIFILSIFDTTLSQANNY